MKKNPSSNIGFYIGRFQPFHLGHLSAIRQALEEVDKLYIGIGSSQYKNEIRNPLSAEERRKIIKAVLEESDIPQDRWEIFQVPDIHNNETWTKHVRTIVPSFGKVFVGEDGLVKELFGKSRKPVNIAEKDVDISASRIREMILNDEAWELYVSPAAAKILKELDIHQRLVSIMASETHR